MAIYGPHWPLKRGNKDTYQVYDSLKVCAGFNKVNHAKLKKHYLGCGIDGKTEITT